MVLKYGTIWIDSVWMKSLIPALVVSNCMASQFKSGRLTLVGLLLAQGVLQCIECTDANNCVKATAFGTKTFISLKGIFLIKINFASLQGYFS